MIVLNHHDDCSSRPSADGKLTGPCNCAVALRTLEARDEARALLARIAQRSIEDDEDPAYLALRIETIVDMLQRDARRLRSSVDHRDSFHQDRVRSKIASR